MRINPFKKYHGFLKGSLLNLFAFRFEIIGWALQETLTLFIMFFLWISIYKENGGLDTQINGYDYRTLLYYLTMISVSSAWMGRSASFDILTDDIRDGNIAISLTKPVSYRARCFFTSIGQDIGEFLIFFIVPYLVTLLVFCFGLGCAWPIWYNVIFYLIAGFFAIAINDSFEFLIGQLGFVTNSLFGIYIIKASIFSFLSGATIPYSFFPEWAQNILAYLPFAGLASDPINIYLGVYDIKTTLIRLGVSGAWAVGMYLVSSFANDQMIRHVEVAGG